MSSAANSSSSHARPHAAGAVGSGRPPLPMMIPSSDDPNDPCSKPYGALEACLADNNRDWRKCQEKLKDWKDCFEAAKKD